MPDVISVLHEYGLIAILTGVGLVLAAAAVLLVLLTPPRYVRQKTLFSQGGDDLPAGTGRGSGRQ